MKILTNFQDIVKIGKECLQSRGNPPNIQPCIPLPEQIKYKWHQTPEALENTIEYIFNGLHHSCYMLCVSNGKPTLYKLVNKKTAPLFKSKINKTIKKHKLSKNKTWRVLQCVLKEHSDVEKTSVEWKRFFSEFKIPLPNGVYIMNLTDATLLRKDGKYAWPISDNKPLHHTSFIPILGGSSQKGFHDVPIPNYDDIRVILGYDMLPQLQTEWSQKKSVAVFRGSPTGCGTTTDTNMRLKLATMRSPELDVGIVTVPRRKLKYDPKKGFSLTQKVPTVSFMTLEEQSRHKYIIHIDGNVAAYRLLKMMLTKSAILKVEGDYILWADHVLIPMTHYVPIKSDLSDLHEKLEWCKQNDDKVRQIAENGYELAKQLLTRDCIERTMAHILWNV